MRFAKLILALILVAAGFRSLSLAGKESYEGTPYQKWSRDTVTKIMSNSPWAQEWGTSTAFETQGQAGSQAVEGQDESRSSFTVRLMSSLVLRQAYFRFLELASHYDALTPEQRQQLDSKLGILLTADVSQEIILAVSYHSNVPTTARDLGRFFDTSTTATLNQSAYLFGPHGRIDLMKYIPANGEATGPRFIFPRVVNGAPVLQPGDKEMRFEVWIPPVNQKLQVRFDAKKMVFQGKLDY
jgi:hypothetical protein